VPAIVEEAPTYNNRKSVNNKRVLEFRQLLREINREINTTANEGKRKKLLEMKEKIMANNPIFK